MSTANLPPNAGEKVLTYVKLSNELQRRSHGQQQEKQAAEAKRPDLIKKAVDALVAHERIREEQRGVVSQALGDHNSALEMLEKLAHHRNTTEVDPIGHEIPKGGGTVKQANHGPVGSPVANYDERESGRRFRDRIMGAG